MLNFAHQQFKELSICKKIKCKLRFKSVGPKLSLLRDFSNKIIEGEWLMIVHLIHTHEY